MKKKRKEENNKKIHGKEKPNQKKLPIGITILVVLSILASIYLIYNILLLGPIEKVIRYIIIAIIIVIDVAILVRNVRMLRRGKTKKHRLFIFGLVLFIVSNCLIGYGISFVYSKIDSVNKDYITYSSSLVTLKDSALNNLEDCHDMEIGIINDTTSVEGYTIPQEIIKNNKLNEKNSIVEYDDFSSMIRDLYDQEVDAIFLSTNYVTMFQGIADFSSIADDTKVIYSQEKKMKNQDSLATNSSEASVTEPFTILLMGVDSEIDGMNKNAAFNGDSLLLVTFNPNTLNATMLSIPRDSYVPIMCFKDQKENKITHAAWYGASCMIDTIENFTGITIDYYAKINFKALVSLVDALGGVEVDVEYSFCEQNSNREWGKNTVYVEKGYQTLNGEQALAYARNRHAWPQYCSKEWNQGTRSDIVRGQHQQAVLEALLKKAKEVRSVDKLYELIDLVSKNLDTNMSTQEILSFYNIGKDIISKGFSGNDSVISIQKLFLKTSDQMIYDESMKLVLSDQIINQGSLDDVVQAMKINLELEEPEMEKTFSYSINDPYEETQIGNGKYPATKLYTLLPNFVGQSRSYAESWGRQNGVNIVFSNSGNGTIISQNYPAKKRVDLIPNKTVTLTLSGGSSSSGSSSNSGSSKINCSTDPDNEACEVPNFVGKTKSSVNSWLSKITGITVKYNEISVAMANGSKVGTITEQKLSSDGKTLTLTIVVEDEESDEKPEATPTPTPKPTPTPTPSDDPEDNQPDE